MIWCKVSAAGENLDNICSKHHEMVPLLNNFLFERFLWEVPLLDTPCRNLHMKMLSQIAQSATFFQFSWQKPFGMNASGTNSTDNSRVLIIVHLFSPKLHKMVNFVLILMQNCAKRKLVRICSRECMQFCEFCAHSKKNSFISRVRGGAAAPAAPP